MIRLDDKSVLYFGDGSPSGVHGLAAGGELVVVDPSSSTSIQLARQFDVVWIDRRTIRVAALEACRQARSKICRIDARDLFERLCGDHPPTVVDTRTNTDRERFGVIRGAVHVPRTVLEWHLDPSSGYRHPAVTSTDQSLVVVCNGGYSSSLAAANLMLLGFTRVSDLVGGHQAWRAAGLPVECPDHSSLDF